MPTGQGQRILVVDDEESICWGLKRALTDEGYCVEVVSSAEDALLAVERQMPALVIMDVRLPGMDGLTALRQIRQTAGAIPVVIITAFGNLQTAVEAVRDGAVEYLTKPFDLDRLVAEVHRALCPVAEQQRGAAGPSPDDYLTDGILGKSAVMQDVFRRIALIVPTDLPVVITGESGTGKELVARAIHRHSARAGRPFVPVHLAALSPTLVESELFGHVRGAFTGAEASRAGILELAHQATVFFDEAGDIPPAIQVKLLRVLEQREVLPVGDTRPRPADFRILAATHRNLDQALQDGSLREDFYYRLAGAEIRLPPLRERVEDIPLLAEYFLRSSRVPQSPSLAFTTAAVTALCGRTWPGNVRELRNAVEHAAVFARGGPISPEHLPAPRHAGSTSAGTTHAVLQNLIRQWADAQFAADTPPANVYEQFLAQVEQPLFEAVLGHTGGNRTAAAEILGIDRGTLRRRLN
jgi:two-component system nitrogen regulation response regulator GlnG